MDWRSYANRYTLERFKNLECGDILKFMPSKKVLNIEKECGCRVHCGYTTSMEHIADDNQDFKIVFNEKLREGGVLVLFGWKWSLDMFEYANPYEVDIM